MPGAPAALRDGAVGAGKPGKGRPVHRRARPPPGELLPGLAAARRTSALAQAELAVRAGLTRTTVGYLESGHRRARPSTVRKLAAALGVAPAALYRTTEKE